MNEYQRPYYLVKIVNKKWADKLMNGEVFMRTIDCFGDLAKRGEDANNQYRGDFLEGFSLSFENNHNPYAYIKDSTGSISEILPNQIGLIDVLTYREKIFCLYALEYDDKSGKFIKPDSRILDFGDTAVIIFNPRMFLYRVCNEMLRRFGNDFWTSFKRIDYNVEYSIGKTYDEFRKSPSYLWQNEFRIALDLAQGRFHPDILKEVTDLAKLTFPGKIIEDTNQDSLSDSIILNIGDISDICVSMSTTDFITCENISAYIPPNSLPPQIITPLEVPRTARPTFFKLVAQLP